MIGIFAAVLAIPLTGGEYWREVALAYLVIMTAFINLFARQAYLGRQLAPWQQALARLPLRPAGYGTRGGKPLEAAHGHAAARRALLISAVVSVVALIVIAVLLLPALRPW